MSQALLDSLLALQAGKVIAYPTEAVYGLGCDPDNEAAVQQILSLKQRPIEKGLIVIASSVEQLSPWINADKLENDFPHVLESWPGPHTWLLPCKPSTPQWLTGEFDTLAVRVSNHPDVKKLCSAFGKGIVSTSANPAGEEPARTEEEVQGYFPNLTILKGFVDISAKPSKIMDGVTQTVVRD